MKKHTSGEDAQKSKRDGGQVQLMSLLFDNGQTVEGLIGIE
jgi:hypothetical protein